MPKIEYDCKECKKEKVCKDKPKGRKFQVAGGATCFEVNYEK